MDSQARKREVSDIEQNRILLRGVPIEELISGRSFAASLFLLLLGRLPDEREETVTRSVLIALMDHGTDTPSCHATLSVLRGGTPLHVAVAAGILSFGERHGGTVEAAARLLQEGARRPGSPEAIAAEIVGLHAGLRERVPGFGHRLHDIDPRTVALFKVAGEHKLKGRHCEVAEAIEHALEDRFKRRLPLNVNGAAAALLSDMGFDWRLGSSFFILSRAAGLIAHAYGEITRQLPEPDLGPVPWESGSGEPEGYDVIEGAE